MDHVVETVNGWQETATPVGKTAETRQRSSSSLVASHRSMQYTDLVFRQTSTPYKNVDPGNKKAKTKHPSAQPEQKLVYEILVLCDAHKEIAGRKMTDRLVWNALSNTNTDLKNPKKHKKDAEKKEDHLGSAVKRTWSQKDKEDSEKRVKDSGIDDEEKGDEMDIDKTEAPSTHSSNIMNDDSLLIDGGCTMEENSEEIAYTVDQDGTQEADDGNNLADEFETDELDIVDDDVEVSELAEAPSSTERSVEALSEEATAGEVTRSSSNMPSNESEPGVTSAPSTASPCPATVNTIDSTAPAQPSVRAEMPRLVPGSTITTASGRKIRLPKTFQPLHKSALKDLHREGNDKMAAMDLVRVRKSAKRRENRQRLVEKKVYSHISGKSSNLLPDLSLIKEDKQCRPSLAKQLVQGSFESSIAEEMRVVWGNTPYSFQNESIDKILRMHLQPDHEQWLQPGAVTLVQPTSGGKSAVTRCAGSILRGVILTVVPLLSIGADQVSKISKQVSEINKAGQRTGSIVAFHLDEVKQNTAKKSLAEALLNVQQDSSATVYLFASPQAILKKEWETVLEKLSTKKLIRLFCFDEVHLYVNFGLTFRRDFVKLKDTLFKWVRARHSQNGPCSLLKIPVLLMTATWDLELARIFEMMTGVHPSQSLFVWASAKEMQRWQLLITVIPAQKKGRRLKDKCKELLEGSKDSKAIIYSNSRKAVGKMTAAMNDFLDHNNIPGDTVEINGELFPEQKFFYTRLFTETKTRTDDEENDPYNPRILIATAGAAGAGLDCSDVRMVLRDGMPQSILDFIQELGRAGRGDDASPVTDKFMLMLSLHDYLYLLVRIHENNDNASSKDVDKDVIPRSEVVQMEVNRLNKLASVLCLKHECLNVELERLGSSPSDEEKNDRITPCGNACPHCTGEFHRMFPPVRREGVVKFLVDSVVRSSHGDRGATELVSLLMNHKDVGQTVYARQRSTKSPDSTTVGLTVLQWIAAGIIDAYVKKNAEGKNEVYLRAGCNDNALFHFNDDSRWERINTVTPSE